MSEFHKIRSDSLSASFTWEGKNLYSVTQKPIWKKKLKILKKKFFQLFFIMNYFSLYCILHWMGIYKPSKKIFFFRGHTTSKISFFTNYTTWQNSNFYSTDRVDPDTPLEMKMKKTKKKFVVVGKGEVPLNQLNEFP